MNYYLYLVFGIFYLFPLIELIVRKDKKNSDYFKFFGTLFFFIVIIDDYMIHIESDTPVNQESVKQRIREYFGYERDMVKKDLRLLSLKAACLAVFGIVVLVIWYYLSLDSESVNLEVLSIIGWVAVWEATSIMIMGRHDLNRLKRNYKRMSEAKIVISEHTVNDQTTDLSL